MEQNHQLGRTKRSFLAQLDSYKRLVGRLIYLTITRPDWPTLYRYILILWTNLAKSTEMWHFVSCVISRVHLDRDSFFRLFQSKLRVFYDFDWASYPITRCSLIGFFVSLGHSHISWKSKNSIQFLAPLLRHNIAPWQLLVANWSGCVICYVIPGSSNLSYATVLWQPDYSTHLLQSWVSRMH